MKRIPCPFVYSTGKRCTGHVARIEAYKAEVVWEQPKDGRWAFFFSPRSHFHLFCSEKSNHAGALGPDNPQMKFHWRELPEDTQTVVAATRVVAQSTGPGES